MKCTWCGLQIDDDTQLPKSSLDDMRFHEPTCYRAFEKANLFTQVRRLIKNRG